MSELKKKCENLQGVEQSMLITLEARAKESQQAKPLIIDPMAKKLYDQMASYIAKESDFRARMGTIIRCATFDEFVKAFINDHPQGVVINLGSGLDTRFYRMDNEKIHWYDVDLPRVMTIRKELLEPHERVMEITGNALEKDWMKQIQTKNHEVLIIMEGMLQFFTPEQVTMVLKNLADEFPKAYVIMDLLSEHVLNDPKLMKKLTKDSGVFHWAVKKSKDVEMMDPRYELVDEINLADRMHLKNKAMKIMSKIPKVRNLNSIVALYQIKN
ncbi:MAG: class I SAM-dependent methyltransferase [Tissierellia bacterium]|nr:class I SAM-dependent methyltransferase [Tissierellia bacterium]